MNLTPDFTLEELTFSQTAARLGILNEPNDEAMANLRLLSLNLLEPARSLLGVPLHVDSGYRSPVINKLVGGATDSAHLEGRAADVIPIGMDLTKAFGILRTSILLPFDTVILECRAWIHLSIAKGQPRRMALLAEGGPGHWSYVLA